ncbi:MAG: PAC2 family protein [Candidatus Omnitrophota bacterium]
MKKIKYFTATEVKNPVMLACWAGMGNVGIGAADFIRIKLGAKLFAQANISDLVSPEFIAVDKGLSSLQDAPNLSVYYKKKPPLLISIGREQLYGRAGMISMERLLEIAIKHKVKKIFTCAAFPSYMHYKESPTIYAAANRGTFLRQIKENKSVHQMEDGQISGLNGLLLEAARKKKIDAACLLATLPIYAVGLPNPRASKALVGILGDIIGFQADMTDLNLSIHEIDKTLEKIEEQLRSLGLEDAEKKPYAAPKVSNEMPKIILDKIEKLFEDARRDKRAAHKLKQELDRWDLFKVYEDRFLDLFREKQ